MLPGSGACWALLWGGFPSAAEEDELNPGSRFSQALGLDAVSLARSQVESCLSQAPKLG